MKSQSHFTASLLLTHLNACCIALIALAVSTSITSAQSTAGLGCIETINVTLGEDCTAVFDPQAISEANGVPIVARVEDENGNIIDTMGIEHVNKTLKYIATDTAANVSCWGYLNVELKRIPDLTSNADTIMCGGDYSILGLRSIEDVEATLDDRCLVNVTDLREEVETSGSRCDTLITFRRITAGVDLDDIPRRVTLHIDTLYEVPLTTDMVQCPYGETLEDAIYIDCEDFDGPPTPDEIAEMRGDTAAYPFVEKGILLDTMIMSRDSITEDTVMQDVLVDGVWLSVNVIVKDTLELFDTTVTSRRVVLPIRPGETCNMSVIYTDDLFEGCLGPDTKILRRWSILNWCTGEEKQCTQWILINDQKGPEVKALRDTTLSVTPWKCFVELPLRAEISENCGGSRLEWTSTHGTIIGDSLITGINLTDGPTEVYLKAVDICGNVSRDTFTITPVDNVPPIVQTEDQIFVTLTGNELDGVASVGVDAIDAGSTDAGCGEISRCILLKEELENPVLDRETGDPLTDRNGNPIYHAAQCKFDGVLRYVDVNGKDTVITEVPYVICKEDVKFCCGDIGDNEVALVVNDISETSATTYGWTIVTVEDKLQPIVTCPSPITIDCDEDINDINFPWPVVSGSVCASEALDYTIEEDLNTCGEGQYTIVWTLAGEFVCNSTVFVTLEHAFDPTTIRWPRHFNDEEELGIRRECELLARVPDTSGEAGDSIDVYGIVETPEIVSMGTSLECGETILVEPVWCDAACGQVLVSYEDQIVESADACKKIVRRWTVIDWCTWTPNSEDGEDSSDSFIAVNDEWIEEDSECEDCLKQPSEDVYYRYENVDLDGHYDFIQVIKILDEIDPEITVVDSITVDVVNGADTKDDPTPCSDSEIVTATVTDECGDLTLDPSTIRWVIEVYDVDGNRIAGPKQVTGAEATMTTGDGSPGDIHTIVWTATDDCGNRAIRETTVTFVDTKNPIAICIETISTATMNIENGTALIWASDYDLGAFDNCGETEVYFKDSLGQKVSSLMFDCSDIPNGVTALIDVQVYVSDQYGNEDYCFARLRIDDNAGVCPNIDVEEAMIAGVVQTELGDKVEMAEVQVLGSGRAEITKVDGSYAFEQLATETSYQLGAKRNDAPLNGVSTLDLVQIQQHILGLRLLDSPYRVIAADVNADTRISAVDLVQLRNLILGRTVEFPSNESWRFVDADQTFERALSPWPFTEVITIDPLQVDMMDGDFVGVKIGDVSGNAIPNSLIASEGRSEKTLELYFSDEVVDRGRAIIPIKALNFEQMTGFQMTISLTGAKAVNILPGALTVEQSFAILDDHTITMAWYNPVSVSSDETLFSIEVDVTNPGQLSQLVSFNNSITSAKAYDNQDHIWEISLSATDLNEGSLILLQNAPNPWNDETTISFSLPESSEATIRVMDITGRIAYEQTRQFGAGRNDVIIRKDDIGASGVWYYEVESGTDIKSKKMILID